MKKDQRTFIVSYWENIWGNQADNLFIFDPYVYHMFERDNILKNFTSIETADFRPLTREDLENRIVHTKKKYDYYIDILTSRLNELHNTTYSRDFWRKSLSCGFVRYIHQFHFMFVLFETYFKADEFTCSILDPARYHTPVDFEEHREVFEATNFGQEQMFSLYVRLFHPGLFPAVSPEVMAGELPERTPPQSNMFSFIWKRLKLYKHRIFGKALRKAFTNLTVSPVTVGLLSVYFSDEHVARLERTTKGAIASVYHGLTPSSLAALETDWNSRALLGNFEKDFDRFDQFFFSTLPYCLPKAFVEGFSGMLSAADRLHARHPKMRNVVGEAWLSDTADSMILAWLKEKYGIKHHYNEHNGFFHPFMGDMVTFQAGLVDAYVTMGWADPTIPNLHRGASLFPFSIPVPQEKEYDILYIGYRAEGRMSQYSSAYAYGGPFAPSLLRFIKSFFSSLPQDTLTRISYRGYPKGYNIKGLLYDMEFNIRDEFTKFRMLPATYEKGQTCKEQMGRARLVIISYSATSYLEALHLNIPFVFFLVPESKFPADGYADFYQPLIEAGICQTDPGQAAALVERIKDDPETWWASEAVQRGRKAFMEKNFNPPEVMIEYLKGLL